MAIGHLAARTHSRKYGHTVAAVVAYRHGAVVTCPRTGKRHDYSCKRDVTATGFVAAVGIDTPLTDNRDAFVGGLEGSERRKDSRVSRDFQGAIPRELSTERGIELTRRFATALVNRFQSVATWAVHTPGKRAQGDRRNTHNHTVLATRRLNSDGTLGAKNYGARRPEAVEIRNACNPRSVGAARERGVGRRRTHRASRRRTLARSGPDTRRSAHRP